MPRPVRPWFRFYTEAVHDRKLRRLTPAQRWLWVAVLAAARESCRPGYLMVSESHGYRTTDLADYAGMTKKEIDDGVILLKELGMLTFDPELGAWYVTHWKERQFESDDTTARTAKHRSKEQPNTVPTSVVGTPPDTETDTETDTELPPPKDPPPPPPNGSLESPAAPASAPVRLIYRVDVATVFDAWQAATGHHRAVLDPKRRNIIEKALKCYPVEDLIDACRGVVLFPHNRGETNGTRYDDLGLVLRDAEHIERFRDRYRGEDRPPAPRLPAGSDMTARNVARIEGRTR